MEEGDGGGMRGVVAEGEEDGVGVRKLPSEPLGRKEGGGATRREAATLSWHGGKCRRGQHGIWRMTPQVTATSAPTTPSARSG